MSIKYSGENVLTYLLGLLNTKFKTKVDKVDGKGLSTNDYTTAEKNKLAGIDTGANKYTHPAGNAASKSAGLYKIATDASSHISSVTAVTKEDITKLGIPAQDTTYDVATAAKAGLMSPDDKTNLTQLKSTVDGLTAQGGEPNQNAFSYVVVGDKTIEADSKTDTLTFAAGDNIEITPDPTNDKVTIKATNVVSKTGDTMTGSLIIKGNAKAVAHENPDDNNKVYMQAVPIEGDDLAGQVAYAENGTVVNFMQLKDDSTVFNQPVSIGSGGTGATTSEGVIQNLGITATATELNYVDGVTSPIQAQIDGKAPKATTLAGYGITNAYTKEEVNSLVSSALIYKGTVATTSELPTSGMSVGWVYNVSTKCEAMQFPVGNYLPAVNAGDNVAWNGTSWDVLAGTIDLSGYVETTDMVEFTNTEVQNLWDSVFTS